MSITKSTKPVWITSDNDTFEDEQEAIEHEAGLNAMQDIPAFMETTKYKGKSIAMVTNAIVAWEKWRATHIGSAIIIGSKGEEGDANPESV